MINDARGQIVVIDGEAELEYMIDGEVGLECMIDGEAEKILVVSDADAYTGEYTVIPLAWDQQILHTEGLMMTDNVTVTEVPYFETSNQYGKTVYIADTLGG
ncbi:MAG: hypothetical protein IJH05_03455 [Firmicutes bacterium]|nr:hypothetical protein [Bacillota bacterium]